MKILLNKVHYPVTTLGPGRRLGIWFQGCSIRCAGCLSRDTWEPDASRALEIETLLLACRHLISGRLDGVTISGGEPFDQPHALRALLLGLWEWRGPGPDGFDILCYSGYPLRRLENRFPEILELLDALIPEPFLETRPLGGCWRGSDNQPVVVFTPLARARYEPGLGACPNTRPAFQVSVRGGKIWYIGVPRRGDLEGLRSAAARRGLEQRDVSWRA